MPDETDPTKPQVEETPCTAEAGDGIVAIDGPGGIEIDMTPKAALETARNLSDAAIDVLAAQAEKK